MNLLEFKAKLEQFYSQKLEYSDFKMVCILLGYQKGILRACARPSQAVWAEAILLSPKGI